MFLPFKLTHSQVDRKEKRMLLGNRALGLAHPSISITTRCKVSDKKEGAKNNFNPIMC